MAPEYPPTPRSDHTDDYHGTQVPDPYRWLEASAHTSEVRAWIEAQNNLTFEYLEGIEARGRIKDRLSEVWDYPKAGAPFKKGGTYFQFRNGGLQNQDVLYVMDTPRDEGRVLLDPNTLSDAGTVALSGYAVSKDGEYLAYATSESGSDWLTWRVREVATGRDLDEVLEHSKFSTATWLPDGSGFYYLRYPAPHAGDAFTGTNEHAKLYLHRLGHKAEEDALVFERPDKPRWRFHPVVSDDGVYLILHVFHSTAQRNLVYYRKLEGEGAFTELVPAFEAQYLFLGNDGATFYFRTDTGAERGRVIAIDIEDADKDRWRTVVPEQADTLQGAQLVGDTLVCLYLRDAAHRVERYSLRGEALGEIVLPGLGSVTSLNGERGDDELFYSFTSFLTPGSAYRFDLQNETSERLYAPKLDFAADDYTARQVFVTSKDGTRVPLFLVHRKDLPNKPNPTLLYGYGGFNVPVLPSFSPARAVWLEQGGVLAVANLRGGGEYGRAWHEAGTLDNKQNVFDDFIACAEYLIAEGVTAPDNLAIEGRSNGGLLVGAVITQRPELFAAALPAVGVLDMLRFHKFTIGWAWASDYGSADDPEQFETLLAYSPLHNLKEGTAYPATLVTTGDFDDRVVPAHSFKFAAALQRAQGGDAPVLIRVQTDAGHGAGKPTRMLIEEQADIYAFLLNALGMSA